MSLMNVSLDWFLLFFLLLSNLKRTDYFFLDMHWNEAMKSMHVLRLDNKLFTDMTLCVYSCRAALSTLFIMSPD